MKNQIPSEAIDAHQEVSQDRLDDARENTELQDDYYDDEYVVLSGADVVDEADDLGTAPESESSSNATLGSKKRKTALWYAGYC
ncbi:hypothetical protein [Natronoglomus mannanivorans]|uniref:Uncharacterized protein n=1 Tax=Natronoglomus mannanivorans TaxID=2979990 RepID=A0AAP3E4T4_9EURY|nr:hypothetical protein [Halobacteria archaeon AArc-xg1-1]